MTDVVIYQGRQASPAQLESLPYEDGKFRFPDGGQLLTTDRGWINIPPGAWAEKQGTPPAFGIFHQAANGTRRPL